MNGPDIKDFDAIRYAQAWLNTGHKKSGDVARKKDDSAEITPDDVIPADTEEDVYTRKYLSRPLLF